MSITMIGSTIVGRVWKWDTNRERRIPDHWQFNQRIRSPITGSSSEIVFCSLAKTDINGMEECLSSFDWHISYVNTGMNVLTIISANIFYLIKKWLNFDYEYPKIKNVWMHTEKIFVNRILT